MPATQEQVIGQAVLDESVRMVMVQLAVSNPSVIPKNVRKREEESSQEHSVRKHDYLPGRQVIEPVENISLSAFLDELEQAGYVLVDAFRQRRKNTRGHQQFYYVVRYSFTRKEYVDDSEESKEFEEVREVRLQGLQKICSLALWRVRAFVNPYFQNEEQVPGQYAMSINLEAREPLYVGEDPNRPVMVYPHDEEGKRIGEDKIPLQPNYRLHIVDNNIQLLPA